MTSKYLFPILIILLLSTGCNAPSRNESASTVTAISVTLTLPASSTRVPSETPPPLQPTSAPVIGTTSTQINVRAQPSTSSNVLGLIPANTSVEILGKDPGGNWLQILYPQGADGKGWVTAQYVLTAEGTEIPIIGSEETNPNTGNVAIAQQQLNVRSGPGTGFNALGTLNPQDVVNLIGKDANGAWLQIEFHAGPDGKGWVNAAFVQAKGVENIPIITEAGEIIGTGTPTGVPSTPTPTRISAWIDNDSQNNPIAIVVFDVVGTHTFIYSGDVSAPTGDSEDWVQFTPNGNEIFATLECLDRDDLQVSILENGQPTSLEIRCGNSGIRLAVKAGTAYLLHFQAPGTTSSIQYLPYTITIQASK